MSSHPRSSREIAGVPPGIQSRLEAAGLRRTLATRAVLGLFLARPQEGLTHAQALAALAARGWRLNRVTLYRLLDRLAACGVLRRQADGQRTWRFRLAILETVPGDAVDDTLPWFECEACHRQFRVAPAQEPARLAAHQLLRALAQLGHQGQRVELSVHGTCADCRGAASP